MTDKIPNYQAVKLPEGKPAKEYSTEERRAEILRLIYQAGDPGAIVQTRLADRYGVHDSTISRDMDALREAVDEHMGASAKLETDAQAEKTIEELQEQGRWYKAWQVRKDLNQFLFNTGHVDREPERREVDVRSRHSEVAYTVVREGDDDPLPVADDDGEQVDYGALGFEDGPVTLEVATPGDADADATEDGPRAGDGDRSE